MEENDECTDYEEFMALSRDQKLQRLEGDVCHGSSSVITSDGLDMLDLMVQAADRDGDGHLSCEEMNESTWEDMGVDPEHLCE